MEQVKKFLDENGLTQSTLARSIGVSTATVSQYLGGYYKGDVSNLDNKISDFISNYNLKDDKTQIEIIHTNDLKTAHFIIDEAVVGEELAIIYGQAGSGKTESLKEYKKTHPELILIESIPGMNIKSVLKEICLSLKIPISGQSHIMITDIANEFKKRESILIIDEAENLTTKTLEAIRRIWDFSRVPTVLVGTPALLNNLRGRNGELLQLYSRISGKWEFKGLNEDDWNALFGEFSGSIKAITKHLRRAVNIYKKALRFSKMKNETLNIGHIKTASSMVILD